MIKYETIISNFDDKVTLYNWLRKVEEALKNASATNFVVNKKGNATLSFSITFADGTTLESGDIVLQQGESVDDARIASGVLQLHLTNGTWLTAGNLGAVSGFSIDALQHLIVTYQDGTSEDLGAIFQGNVNIDGNFTANSIIENMGSNYSFEDLSQTNLTKDNVYAGVCKNGNKLTIVYATNITRTGAINASKSIARFRMPTAVLAKLYPTEIAGYQVLAFDEVKAVKNDGTFVPLKYFIDKYPQLLDIYLQATTIDDLPLNTKCYLRFELTFLLSDNLISQE